MSGQQKRRGRDPEIHEIHTSLAAANEYRGLLGEITLVQNADGAIIQLRAHNGIDAGGFAMLLTAGPTLLATAVQQVSPEFSVTVPAGGSFTLNHGLGYIPGVVMMDGDGTILPANPDLTVTHDDTANTTFENAGATDLTFIVILA